MLTLKVSFSSLVCDAKQSVAAMEHLIFLIQLTEAGQTGQPLLPVTMIDAMDAAEESQEKQLSKEVVTPLTLVEKNNCLSIIPNLSQVTSYDTQRQKECVWLKQGLIMGVSELYEEPSKSYISHI